MLRGREVARVDGRTLARHRFWPLREEPMSDGESSGLALPLMHIRSATRLVPDRVAIHSVRRCAYPIGLTTEQGKCQCWQCLEREEKRSHVS